jgi:UTP--glucose-1-phosphate uridylyltransferase
MKKIRKAVFPVAGLGTRFLPATKASPKEMLPVVDKPLIQYAVEEAAAAGITDMIFITGRNKRAIEDHFDKAAELETSLINGQKHQMLEAIRAITPPGINFIYIRQAEPLGLGHAVLCAAPVVGDEPFVVILADDLIAGVPGATEQMVRQFDGRHCILGVEDVPRASTGSYGIVSTLPSTGRSALVNGIVEKPAPADAPSTLAVVGRYVLLPEIFDVLRDVRPGKGGEIQLTDGISELVARDLVTAFRYEGQRYDCGSKQGYLRATVELGLRHPEEGAAFRKYLTDFRF